MGQLAGVEDTSDIRNAVAVAVQAGEGDSVGPLILRCEPVERIWLLDTSAIIHLPHHLTVGIEVPGEGEGAISEAIAVMVETHCCWTENAAYLPWQSLLPLDRKIDVSDEEPQNGWRRALWVP